MHNINSYAHEGLPPATRMKLSQVFHKE